MQVDILQKKKDILSRIYHITKETPIAGEEEDAQRYIDLMQSREELFDQIKVLDEKIPGGKPCKEAEGLLADIKKTAADIYALDKANEAAVSKIIANLKKSLKNIKDGKIMAKNYAENIAVSDGMFFDKKN